MGSVQWVVRYLSRASPTIPPYYRAQCGFSPVGGAVPRRRVRRRCGTPITQEVWGDVGEMWGSASQMRNTSGPIWPTATPSAAFSPAGLRAEDGLGGGKTGVCSVLRVYSEHRVRTGGMRLRPSTVESVSSRALAGVQESVCSASRLGGPSVGDARANHQRAREKVRRARLDGDHLG